jgi:predicted metalloenzyme YecM
VPVNAENTFLLFKELRPFKLKKEYPSEQWQIISFGLIPLKTPVSFHWTVPLKLTKYTVKKILMNIGTSSPSAIGRRSSPVKSKNYTVKTIF